MKIKQKQSKKYEVREPEGSYSSLGGQDLNELAESILKIIGQDKQKRATLVGLLVHDVATKQEFTAILAELKAMREVSDKRFEASERRFEAIENELKAMREVSDKRFEAIENELKAMREASERRFEAIDRRFEQQRQDFHLEIQALNKSLSSKIDRLGSRWGMMAEDTFSKALKEVLGKAGFQVTKWKSTDTNAEFFARPRDAEIDILIRNGKQIAIEVKSSVGVGDIEIFEKSVRFYEKSEGKKVDEKIIVGVFIYPRANEYAKELGIKIVPEIEDIISE